MADNLNRKILYPKLLPKSFYDLSVRETLAKLKTDSKRGLDFSEIKRRREDFGFNVLPDEFRLRWWRIAFAQITTPLILILLAAGLVTLAIGDETDGYVILAAVVLNAFFGFIQEFKAVKSLQALKRAAVMTARVVREGKIKEVLSRDLVPGDIILLKNGDKVPADSRLIESWQLKVNEAALTGEWLAVPKNVERIKRGAPLAERTNQVFLGTIVEAGEGKAVVTATGIHTELGKIASLIKSIESEQTPYQIKLKKFSLALSAIIGLLSAGLLIGSMANGKSFIEVFDVVVAAAVAAIPEGLPVVSTAILALGMQRILKRQGLVKKLTAAETLGSVSVIATDKTLTLTQGLMRVKEVVPFQNFKAKEVLEISVLANEAFVENPDSPLKNWIVKGSPTDKAILKHALEQGIDPRNLRRKMPLLEKIPFDQKAKFISAYHKADGRVVGFYAGAPERLLRFAAAPKSELTKIQSEISRFAQYGFRIIGVAKQEFGAEIKELDGIKPERLSFAGLIILEDPIRPAARPAIKLTKKAGVRTILVTGDHPQTAVYVAKEIGLVEDARTASVVTGTELDKMSDKELESRLDQISVYARVEPAHKMRIVKSWQNRGETVAMTGDGVNDAPALRKADIGIALGSGTDVAKEVADLVLLSDNFAVIPAAIEEGRVIVDNIRKVITFLMASAFTEVFLVSLSLLTGMPLPITAALILIVNLVADGLPGLAFTFESKEAGIMERKPEPKNGPLITSKMKRFIIIISVWGNSFLLGVFAWAYFYAGYDLNHVRTLVFAALSIGFVLFSFSCRNLNRNIWRYKFWDNTYLNLASFLSVAATLLIVFWQPFQKIFRTAALGYQDGLIVLLFSLSLVGIMELVKFKTKN